MTVDRYDFNPHPGEAGMELSPTGEYVRYEDAQTNLAGFSVVAYQQGTWEDALKNLGRQVRIETRDGFEGRKWAVCLGGNVLNKEGEWEWEPQPSSRDDDFFKRCRFDSAEEAYQFFLQQRTEGK
jgi:hypothetical protein